MGKASSAKKVARLAQRGKGRKVRMQGGTAFPIIIAVVVVLGVLLVTSARHFNKADAAGPKIGSHWHLAYGVYICDHYLDPFKDNKESSADYPLLQIHSHGDGVMHWHPSNEQAIGRTTGRAAQFKVFLGLYGISLTDKKLTLSGAELTPPSADVSYTSGKDTCKVNGKDEKSSLRVIVWNRYDDPNSRTVHVSKLGHERIVKDQQVFVVAFVPDSLQNSEIPLPKWATDLPTLGSSDSISAPPTTVAGASGTEGTVTTIAGTPTSAASATTAAPATSAAPTTAN